MLFFENDIKADIIGCYKFDFENDTDYVCERDFCMLSLRVMAEEKTKIISNGKTYSVGKGDLIFIPPNTPYERKTKKEELFVFHFLAENFKKDIYIMENVSKKIEDLFREAYKTSIDQPQSYRLKLNSVLYDVLFELAAPSYSEEVKRAVDLIKHHYCESDFRISEISKKIHLSESRIRKIFKEETGMSPKEYLCNMRFERAMTLLKSGYISVKEVSDMVGFTDSKHFSSEFKKKYGISPVHCKSKNTERIRLS